MYDGTSRSLAVASGSYTCFPFANMGVIIDSVGTECDLVGIACSLIVASGRTVVDGHSLAVASGDYMSIISRLKKYAPSFLKSLMQKIIRYRPLQVEGIDSKLYLLATFITLYQSPGALVPNLNRSVSGKESAVKRLAISIIEDGVCFSDKPMLSMLAASLLFREKITYHPHPDIIR